MTNNLDSNRIIELLESTDDPGKTVRQLVKKANVAELVTALKQADSGYVRVWLCQILGRRCDVTPLPALIECLQDPLLEVRSEAAEALGNIGDQKAGPALLQRFKLSNEEGGAQHLISYALGAVGYRPAIPALIRALGSNDEVLSTKAALSLGALGAQEAKEVIEKALSDKSYSQNSIKLLHRALSAIQLASIGLEAQSSQTALPLLVQGINSSDPLLNQAAIRVLGTIGGPDAKAILLYAQELLKDCALIQRTQEALAERT